MQKFSLQQVSQRCMYLQGTAAYSSIQKVCEQPCHAGRYTFCRLQTNNHTDRSTVKQYESSLHKKCTITDYLSTIKMLAVCLSTFMENTYMYCIYRYTVEPLYSRHLIRKSAGCLAQRGVPYSGVNLYTVLYMWLGLQTVSSLERCTLF